MGILICSKCHRPVPDSFHCFSEWCTCKDWVRYYEKKGWKINPNQLRLMNGEELPGEVDHYVDWEQSMKEMKENFEKWRKKDTP